jgi:hypothetical protein
MNNSKRPTTSKPFNSSTTHPASIPSTMSSNKTQKREHVTSTKSGGGKEGGPSTEAEIGQSGGGGGGGTGAGSIAGAGNEGEIDDLTSGSAGKGEEKGKGKGIDSSKVHPGSIGSGGEGKGKRDAKL